MLLDLQKGSMLKRFSAWLLDAILWLIVAAGVAWLMSAALGMDSHLETMNQCYIRYEEKFDTSFSISQEEYEAMTPEARQRYEDAYQALSQDPEAGKAYGMLTSLVLLTTSISILAAYLLLEFLVPLLLRNGQTLGKKIFGLAVMRTSGVKINGVCLFIRTVLGKYTIETMIPVLILTMIFFGTIGFVGTLVILGILVLQIILVAATRTNSPIHDLLACTVVVDLSSQMIFDSQQELVDYKNSLHAEQAARQDY